MSYAPNFFGSAAAGPSAGTASDYQNGTLSTISAATPVSANASGQIIPTDVTTDSSALSWAGLTALPINSGALGQVSSDGRITNIPSGLGFSVGNPVWVGLGGTLTNVQPDLTVPGWATGYWVLFVGVVVVNQFNNTQQDIQLLRQIIGQL